LASSLAKTGYHILDLGAFVFWFFTRTLDCQVTDYKGKNESLRKGAQVIINNLNKAA